MEPPYGAPADPPLLRVHPWQFVTLWREYAEARERVPKGNLVEVCYDELAKDPIATIGKIYDALSLDGFDERMRGRVAATLDKPSVKGHRVNKLGTLPADLRAVVAKRWSEYCEAWGYDWK